MRSWLTAAFAALTLVFAPAAAGAAVLVTFSEDSGRVVDLNGFFGGDDELPAYLDRSGLLFVRFDPLQGTLVAPDVSGGVFAVSTKELLLVLHAGLTFGFDQEFIVRSMDVDTDVNINGYALSTLGPDGLTGPRILTADGLAGFQTWRIDPALRGLIFAFATDEVFGGFMGEGGPESSGGLASVATTPTFWSIDNVAVAVPEPGTWALMIGGFGAVGAALRRRVAQVAA